MQYANITKGHFISRPNRFIAYVDIHGKQEKVHVKNTGRCRELLTDGAVVYLERSDESRLVERATEYDLVGVKKGTRLINMDSSAPNKAVGEWLAKGGVFKEVNLICPEKKYGNSRFDFYVEADGREIFIEVKGVTLERDNAAYFPDAPSERALKHVEELMKAVAEGYEAYIIFVVQMKDIDYYSPNEETQPDFAKALRQAETAGVHILCYDCHVTEESMEIADNVPVVLSKLDLISQPLLTWYDKGHRTLPWRENPKPYYVWLSEIMLQQTRVEAVKGYFERFILELPDVESLATVEDDKLMKLWEGLGYYNRARNLKKAAAVIMEEYGAEMPSDYENLIKLPGIGSYTAGAIASIAYGKPIPAVDGNVLRVLARLRTDSDDILSPKTKKRVEQELEYKIPRNRAGDFNQALMELGATVCLPNGMPRCEKCPWNKICEAYRQGNMMEFPYKKSKKERVEEAKTILVIKDENKTAFIKRPENGLLAGLYGFPTLDGTYTKEEVIHYMSQNGFRVIRIKEIEKAKHIFSHRQWNMIGYEVRVDELAIPVCQDRQNDWIFIDKEEARNRYSIPSAYAAYKKYLEEDKRR